MLKLSEIRKDAIIDGIVSGQTVKVVSIEPIGDEALTVIFKDNAGSLGERMLFPPDENSLTLVDQGRPWSFTGNGADFKLAAEAHRINLAHLFDPLMAVHTSTVEPLPHQITAVYEAMLPKQPLRSLLADDPGSGKTIMAGLNQPERYILAIVLVDGDMVEGPYYLQAPFEQEPGFGVTSINYKLSELLSLAQQPKDN